MTDGGGPDRPVPADDDTTPKAPMAARVIAPFAHASEAEMARILDFYAVRWQYEPHVFSILWNLDGDVVESFAPDFYLPDLDVYLEMTTLKQRLVRKKNRKLRRVRELYPDLRVKLFYARDFRALMLKYGKFALVGELSGTLGQAPSTRDHRTRTPAPLAPVVEAPAAVTRSVVLVPVDPATAVHRSRSARRRRAAAARRAAGEIPAMPHSGDAA
jgi:hypothetical protein